MKNRDTNKRSARIHANIELSLDELYRSWQQLKQNEIIIESVPLMITWLSMCQAA